MHMVKDIRDHTEGENMRQALASLDSIIAPSTKGLDKVFVFDADRTLASVDAGSMLWKELLQEGGHQPKHFFAHPKWQYSYKASHKVAWLHEEIPEPFFNHLCELIASRVGG